MAVLVPACYSRSREARHETLRRRRPDRVTAVRARRSCRGSTSRRVPRSRKRASALPVRRRGNDYRGRCCPVGGAVHISRRLRVSVLLLGPVHLPVLIWLLEPVCVRGARLC